MRAERVSSCCRVSPRLSFLREVSWSKNRSFWWASHIISTPKRALGFQSLTGWVLCGNLFTKPIEWFSKIIWGRINVQFPAVAEWFYPGWSHCANPSWGSVAQSGSDLPSMAPHNLWTSGRKAEVQPWTDNGWKNSVLNVCILQSCLPLNVKERTTWYIYIYIYNSSDTCVVHVYHYRSSSDPQQGHNMTRI